MDLQNFCLVRDIKIGYYFYISNLFLQSNKLIKCWTLFLFFLLYGFGEFYQGQHYPFTSILAALVPAQRLQHNTFFLLATSIQNEKQSGPQCQLQETSNCWGRPQYRARSTNTATADDPHLALLQSSGYPPHLFKQLYPYTGQGVAYDHISFYIRSNLREVCKHRHYVQSRGQPHDSFVSHFYVFNTLSWTLLSYKWTYTSIHTFALSYHLTTTHTLLSNILL